jgi:SEL1 protein
MHYYGLGTMQNCPLALQLYKRVVERGRWSHLLNDAYELYRNGKTEQALLLYEQAAEWGFEIGQSNAAFIYDKVLQHNISTHHTNAQMAFRFYRQSAEQRNMMSHLRLGDFYYYGFGTSRNAEKAAEHYQAASDMRNAQASFNLGYLHHVKRERERGRVEGNRLFFFFFANVISSSSCSTSPLAWHWTSA